MKTRKRFAHKALSRVEALEVRQFLSAAILGGIPTQSVAVGLTSPPISLGSYFKDTLVPAGDSVVELKTNLPAPNDVIPIMLTDSATPQTVANFLHYITSGEYANSIIHRNATGFVLQGGEYYPDGSSVAKFAAIPSEASTATLHNTIGTITAALSSDANSATDGFFFNMANNDGTGTTPNLNDASDGGPFTTFGKVIYNGMSVLNAIAALPIADASSVNVAWNTLPVQNASGGNYAPIVANSVTAAILQQHPTVEVSGPVMSAATQQSAPVLDPNTGTGQILVSESASNLVVLNPQILPGGLTYSVTSQNPNVVTGSVTNGQLTLQAGGTSGSSKVTVTATDLGGGAVSQTFVVKQDNRQSAGGGLFMSLAGPLPASLTAGGAVPNDFRIRFFNHTYETTQGSVGAAIVLTTSGLVDDAVATLASTSFEVNLNGQASRTVKLTSAPTVPASVPAGTYRVLLVDQWGIGTSFDTGKTIIVKAQTVDLSGTFSRTISKAKAGKRTNVSFTISNESSASVSAAGMLPYQIESSPDGLLSDATVLATGKKKISLKPGKRMTISMPITFKQAGSQKLILVIDPNNAVFPNDSNPRNNIVVATSATTVS